MKPTGPKIRNPNSSKSSGTVEEEEDIEIEIAEVLYGLRMQTYNSKTSKFETKDRNGLQSPRIRHWGLKVLQWRFKAVQLVKELKLKKVTSQKRLKLALKVHQGRRKPKIHMWKKRAPSPQKPAFRGKIRQGQCDFNWVGV